MQILVYGFYHQQNVGDNLFIKAFEYLFPHFTFKFVNQFYKEDLENYDTIFIGGGSFLNQPLRMELGVYNLLKSKRIFYIGIGAETSINSEHRELLELAKLVSVREPEQVDEMKKINSNTIFTPDLVFALPVSQKQYAKKDILILPNIYTVPNWQDPQWKHASWNYFKSEFAQFLDSLIDSGNSIKFFPMSCNAELNDISAAHEIISAMKNKNSNCLVPFTDESDKIEEIFSTSSAVITQRYHGIILSEMMKIPYVSLYHHDKLRDAYPQTCENLNYYGISKSSLYSALNQSLTRKYQENSIKEKFQELTKQVLNS